MTGQLTSKRPRIVLTNDDGIHSPGLRAAVEAVLSLGDVLVIAPSSQQTGMGRSFYGDKDDWLHPIAFSVAGHTVEAYHCDCSPALTVEHGLHLLYPHHPPDLLISGINYGENIGNSITLSGTVGAALQGASMDIPALAISMETDFAYHYAYGEVDWSTACSFLRLFAEKMVSHVLPDDVDVLKVDIPRTATPETPWRMTRVARHGYYRSYFEKPSPQSTIGEIKYHANRDMAKFDPDSDVYALVIDKVVSVSPLSLDLTSRIELNRLHEELIGERPN